MNAPRVQDPDYVARVRGCFDGQTLMRTIGARLTRLEPGAVDIAFAYRADLAQQNGFIHAGIVTALIDTACGLAAYTLMPADADVLSVEFKVNLLRPAAGERFLACGLVIKPGLTLMVTRGDLWALAPESSRIHVATMQATMIRR